MTTKKAARVNALTTFAIAAFSIAIFNAYVDEKFKDIENTAFEFKLP